MASSEGGEENKKVNNKGAKKTQVDRVRGIGCWINSRRKGVRRRRLNGKKISSLNFFSAL
jgi:hypothetical protein